MDSDKLDALWDRSMKTLSDSYGKTWELVLQNKNADAAKEYKANFEPTIQELFAECSHTYPVRFEKISETGDWCDWMENLDKTARTTGADLTANKPDLPRQSLTALRGLFVDLHQKTDRQNDSDAIFALYQKLQDATPSAAELKKIQASLAQAKPSIRTKAKVDAYAKAKAGWTAEADKALQDGQIDPKEKESLQKAADALYGEYGVSFE